MSTARNNLFALIASIPGSGTVNWCDHARAHLDAYRQEVLREAAEALRMEHRRIFCATKPDTCAEAEFLDRMADSGS